MTDHPLAIQFKQRVNESSYFDYEAKAHTSAISDCITGIKKDKPLDVLEFLMACILCPHNEGKVYPYSILLLPVKKAHSVSHHSLFEILTSRIVPASCIS